MLHSLPVKGIKLSVPHTFCDTGPRFLRSHLNFGPTLTPVVKCLVQWNCQHLYKWQIHCSRDLNTRKALFTSYMYVRFLNRTIYKGAKHDSTAAPWRVMRCPTEKKLPQEARNTARRQSYESQKAVRYPKKNPENLPCDHRTTRAISQSCRRNAIRR